MPNQIFRLATSSDYEDELLQLQEQDYAQSQWQQFLKGATEQFESATETLETTQEIDLSKAYASFQRGRLATSQQTELGTGFREQLLEEQEVGLFAEQQDIVRRTAEDYQSLVGQFEETVFEQAEDVGSQLQQLDELAIRYGEDVLGLDRETLAPTETGEITEQGKLFYDRVLNQPVQGEGLEQFADFLRTEGGEDLYNFYFDNLDLAKNLIGGLESGEFDTEREARLTVQDTLPGLELTPDSATDYETKPLDVTVEYGELNRQTLERDVTINGKQVELDPFMGESNLSKGTKKSKEINKELNAKFEDKKANDVAYYNNDLYLYNGATWVLVKEK